jgi:hypothetical protein
MTFEESIRIIPGDVEYSIPTQRSDAEKVLDSILDQVAEDAAAVLKHAEKALEMLKVTDRDGAARFASLPNQARKLVEHVQELRRLR